MTGQSGDPPSPGSRPGRRALFSGPYDPGLATGDGGGRGDDDVVDRPPAPPGPGGGGPSEEPSGRRALFSGVGPRAATGPTRTAGAGADGEEIRAGITTVVVECRTCLNRTPMSLVGLGLSLVPSLWLPTRPWPRLMRCPSCHRVSWCRIEWPRLRGSD